MQRRGAFLLTALVVLFFVEAQRAFFASLFALAYDALFPAFDPVAALLALLPLIALLVPFVPLARFMERPGLVAVAAAGVAVFRLPMAHPALPTRLVGAAVVLAFFAVFLTWAVGLMDRRALAAGTVLGLVADQLLRLAGTSYDLSLQPAWVPVQAVLSLALLALAVAWSRSAPDGPPRTDDGPLERRAGGLRLRGALALGPILFLELHVLGLPPVLVHWTGVGYEAAALLTAAAGGVALALALAGHGPTRGRATVLALVALVAGPLAAGWWIDGVPAAVAMAVGHAAALLLIARTLDPASGRRSGGVVALALGLFVLFTALYGLSFFAAFTLPLLDAGAPWVFGAAVLLLAGAGTLLPQAAGTAPVLRPAPGAAVGLAVLAAAELLIWGVIPRAPAPAQGGVDAGTFRVATLNAHYGFDEDWRFEPRALARLLAELDPDVVALQEVPAGIPTSYGVDLSLLAARALGAAPHFFPTANGLLGEAVLTRMPTVDVRAAPLPGDEGGPTQVLRLRVAVGNRPVDIHALHLSVVPGERVPQIEAALERADTARTVPAVVLGDLNAERPGPVTDRLVAAGFEDSQEASVPAGRAPSEPGGTWPAQMPERRIDWIWVRGLDVVEARVHETMVSDHRLVTATLRLPDRGGPGRTR